MAAKKKVETEPNFEKDLEVLEKIVEELEEGGLPLDVSIKKFEDGMRLAQSCDKALSAAEKKIELLTKNASGELVTKPFDEPEGAPAPETFKRSSSAAKLAKDDEAGDETDREGEKDPGALLF